MGGLQRQFPLGLEAGICMREVTLEELCSRTGALLKSVAEGQRITVTIRGRPVA